MDTSMDVLRIQALMKLKRVMNSRNPGGAFKGKELLALRKMQVDCAKYILDFIKVWKKLVPDDDDADLTRQEVEGRLAGIQEKLSATNKPDGAPAT